MLPEISLHILDIAQNSIRAEASLIEIELKTDTRKHTLTLIVRDNGRGMTPEQIEAVTDPFYTSRTTRRVGLGVPFLKQSAECTGGSFQLQSALGEGTELTVVYHTDHIDCIPLGEMTETMISLITMNETVEFRYLYAVDERQFILDTREVKAIMGDISLKNKEVTDFIREFLTENKRETDH